MESLAAMFPITGCKDEEKLKLLAKCPHNAGETTLPHLEKVDALNPVP